LRKVVVGYRKILKKPLCKYLPRDMRTNAEYVKFFKPHPDFAVTAHPLRSDPTSEHLVLTLDLETPDPFLPELAKGANYTDDQILLKFSFYARTPPRYVDPQTGANATLLLGNDVQMIPYWRIVLGRRVGKVAVWHADSTMTEIIPPTAKGVGAQDSFSLAMLDGRDLMIKMNNFTLNLEDYKNLAADFQENGRVEKVQRADWEELAFRRMAFPAEWQLIMTEEPTETKIELKSIRDKTLYNNFVEEVKRLPSIQFEHVHPRQDMLRKICQGVMASDMHAVWPLIVEFMQGRVYSHTRVEWLIRATIKGEAAAISEPSKAYRRLTTSDLIN